MARICREGGAWVSTNVMVRDLDLFQVPGVDGRRLEVVAGGGAQLAIDVTLVSALRGDGTARAGSATRPGAALVVARRPKERTYPELAGEGGRARLVVNSQFPDLVGATQGPRRARGAEGQRGGCVAKKAGGTPGNEPTLHEVLGEDRYRTRDRCFRLSLILCSLQKKGDVEDAGNHRPICASPALFKLFATILYARLYSRPDKCQPPDQCGFRRSYQTVDDLMVYWMLDIARTL